MTEHEKLQDINDAIWYKCLYTMKMRSYCVYDTESSQYRPVDVRTIIFTKEFMDKYVEYVSENVDPNINLFYSLLEKSLKDPVWYLYELLKLWKRL